MAATGIDASVELERVLSTAGDPRLSEANGNKTLYRSLQARLENPTDDEAREIVVWLIRRLGIWWSPTAYAVFPVLVPWAVRDRSCRYDQGPESWGSPRDDGFLRDDNSIIKKLPLTVAVEAPSDHPYCGRRPWRGFTACHVWRDLPGGAVAGESPWLYSFLPNLVWLPRALAPLSDRHGSFTSAVLQAISHRLFRAHPPAPEVRIYAETAWQKLQAPEASLAKHWTDPNGLALFTPSLQYLTRRLRYNQRLTAGVGRISNARPAGKIICTRYTEGLPRLSSGSIRALQSQLDTYDRAVLAALG